MKPKPYMNPYLAGLFLGFVLLATIYITGRGLGASGGVKSVALYGVEQVAPDHWDETRYYQDYEAGHAESPLNSWLFYEIIGVVIGAFISGVISNRIALKMEKGPSITIGTRTVFAVIGGLLFGFGSQLGRGCTSGSALSGMAVMSFGGIITMIAIFGGGYMFAYFYRGLWLKQGGN